MSDVVILKTALLYEVNMMTDALTEAGVPHYTQMSTFSGAQFAMPAFPAQGPGQFFSVLVPEIAAEDAREILVSLPIIPGNNPGLWSHNPRPWAKRFFIAVAVVTLVGFAWNVLAGLKSLLPY